MGGYFVTWLSRPILSSKFLDPCSQRKVNLLGDLTPGVEVVAPPIEEPPPARKTDVHTPLPLPLPNIPVGGRLAHFAQDWAKITDDKWVLSVIRDGYRIPFLERPIQSPNPVFFQQPLSQHLEEEVASLLSKGAVEEIIPECPGHPRLGKDHRRQMGPLCNKRWLQNSVSRTTNSVTKPSLLPAASKSASGRRSRQSSLKGGSGGDNSGMSRTLLQNFPSSQEERETQADNRPLCAQSFCVHTDIQNGDTEKSERCHSTKGLGIFI